MTNFPVGIWCQNDVVLTSMRRCHHVASTLIRRHFTPCARWVHCDVTETTITHIYADAFFMILYFQLVHRTLAGILGSLAAIAVMSAFGMVGVKF